MAAYILLPTFFLSQLSSNIALPLSPWTEHNSTNCFEHHGAQVLDGGRSLGIMSLAMCQEKCLEHPDCGAVTFHLYEANHSAAHNCYLRASVELEECADQPDYATYTHTTKAQQLQEQVNAAIAQNKNNVTVSGGNYDFGYANFNIHRAKGLKILAPRGTVSLLFSGSAGVNISDTTDLYLENWSIDYLEGVSQHNLSSFEATKGKNGVNVTRTDLSANIGITFNLWNSTRVAVQDLTIRHAPFMAVTAFNGGGAHVFHRLKFEPKSVSTPCVVPGVPVLCHLVGKRDALHFSDQRVGPTITDSIIGYTGDDFFNIHTTLMIVIRCEATACLMVNPHLRGVPRNTVYGSNSVMEMVVPGDSMSFYSWLDGRFMTKRYGGSKDASPPLTVTATSRVTDPAVLKQATTLSQELGICHQNPVFCTNVTVPWDPSDVWRVEFSSQVPAGVGRTAMVQIDSISNAGTVLRNNIFTNTSCNLGRYKSSHSVIDGNTFTNAVIPNLELTWLPQFFEGPVRLENVSVANNRIQGEGKVPIHCGPWCEHPTCVGPPKFGPWDKDHCLACPSCYSGDTAWTSGIRLHNNTIVESE